MASALSGVARGVAYVPDTGIYVAGRGVRHEWPTNGCGQSTSVSEIHGAFRNASDRPGYG